ncbi:NAD(P)/FAD-dependent oxidoreductase [Enemella sp. A6]|uniref:NAD(P)/FAD-dependent oxidoreductase n=1 Tax=Enemella sp. A6 TaxID=3440152 RepID=UPI003EB6B719
MPTAQFAVVGAGPLGSTAARYLAEAGASVVLIGPGDPADVDPNQPWSGWSDESRMFHAVDLPLVSAILAKRSRARFGDLEARSGVQFSTANPSLTVSGAPRSERTPGIEIDTHFDIATLMQNAADIGIEVERIEADDLAERYPALRFNEGHFGLFHADGLVLNPRRYVEAQQTLAERAGAGRVLDHAISITEEADGVSVRLAGGDEVRAEQVVLAAGAHINLDGLLPRPLDTTVLGITIALFEVDEDTESFPTLMYTDTTSAHPYSGLIVPPLRYPDGKLYLKLAGTGGLRILSSKDEATEWLAAGGDGEGAAAMIGALQQLLPGVQVRSTVTRPCLASMNHANTPYVGHVGERMVVLTEGDHGVTVADELGRLAADLARYGIWRDSLPAHVFTPRFR